MPDMLSINSVSEAHHALGMPKPKHPLVSVIKSNEIRRASDFQGIKVVSNFYQIMFKATGCGNVNYGRNSYDYESGTLIFTAPGQVMVYENQAESASEDAGEWVLVFHPDLIRRSNLAEKISQYTFFNYDINEALHLSDEERLDVEELLGKIIKEYSKKLDRHSQHLIILNIELLLDYCVRYYDRQFYTRANLNTDVFSRFERLLSAYFQSDKLQELGLPTVNYCGKELNLSPNYLSDLLKKETGKSAQEHIHLFIIDKAKDRLLNSTSSITEIGYELGFGYPQHFSSLFKSKTGFSPREYRNLN